MHPILLHIHGPIAIYSYGFFIALGVCFFMICVKNDKKCIELGIDKNLINIIYTGFIGAFFGGRIMSFYTDTYFLNTWLEFFLPWHGGLSVMGSIIGSIMSLTLLFANTQTPLLIYFDLIAPYVPLLQSIGRIGCYCAGCCYGSLTNVAWSIIYTNPQSLAPLNMQCHPTQLYSSILLFIIFLCLYFQKNNSDFIGKNTLRYLVLISIERFFIDFLRGDRTFSLSFGLLISDNQLISIILLIISVTIYIFLIQYYKYKLITILDTKNVIK